MRQQYLSGVIFSEAMRTGGPQRSGLTVLQEWLLIRLAK